MNFVKSYALMQFMIQNVKVKKLILHNDDRGFFAELVKQGEETFARIAQTNYTETYPAVIKAFHWHKYQDDIWFCSKGNIQVVLYDRRARSKTHKKTSIFYMGETNPILLFIPRGVVHGYRVLGNKTAGIFYHTTKPYNPEKPDEERIAFNDKEIGFDWITKNK